MNDLIKNRSYASSLLRRFSSDEAGTTAIEYALIASGISVAIIAAVNGVGAQVLVMFQSVVAAF